MRWLRIVCVCLPEHGAGAAFTLRVGDGVLVRLRLGVLSMRLLNRFGDHGDADRSLILNETWLMSGPS